MIPTKRATHIVVKEFLDDRIITRFGVPTKITTNNAQAFSSIELSRFCFDYGIILSHSSNYNPQGNGLAKSSNKNLMAIIKKIVGDNKKSWDSKLKYALWEDRITKKKSTKHSPFEMVYGMSVTLPIHLKLPIYHLLEQFTDDKESLQERIHQLIELDENRRKAFHHLVDNQGQFKRTFNKKARLRHFEPGDVLMWD